MKHNVMMLPDDATERLSRLDASGRSLAQQCMQKYYYRWIWQRVPRHDDDSGSWARDFGSAIHKGLEETDVDAALVAFHATYDGAGKGPTPEQVETVRAEPYANRQRAHIHAPDRGEMMLKGYWAKYAEHDTFTVLGRELRLTAPLVDGVTYFGTVDQLVEWPRLVEGPMHRDFKTTGSRMGAAGMVTNPFPQQEGYIWVRLNDPTLYDQEPPGVDPLDMYAFNLDILCKDDTLDGRNYRSGRSFERAQELRTGVDIIYWRDETIQVVSDIHRCADRGWWPGSAPNACSAWGRQCEYLPLCKQRDLDARMEMLVDDGDGALYQQESWQPEEGFTFSV